MAVDTSKRRASALGFGVPFLRHNVPSGSVDVGHRATMVNMYSGIEPSGVVLPLPDNLIDGDRSVTISSAYGSITLYNNKVDYFTM